MLEVWIVCCVVTDQWWRLETGLEKKPISQGLVTLFHICGVIPTPQLPETPSAVLRSDVPASNRECFMMFHNAL